MTDAGRSAADGRPCFLLVDDKSENLLSLEAVLEGEGYALVRATSGAEALGKVLKHDFAAIVMDVAMPGLDGFETARLIKDRPSNQATPIIFLTASIYDVEHMFLGYDTGAVDYLYKPISPIIVRAKLRVFADLYHQRQKIQTQARLLHDASRKEREQMVARVEASLQASEARYEAAAREAPIGLAIIDRAGTWRRANPRALALLGYTLADMPSLPDLIAGGEARDRRELSAVLEGDVATFAAEMPLTHRSGHVVWAALTLSRFVAERTTLVAVTLEDVTARRARERVDRCLSAAGRALLDSLDDGRGLAEAARAVVPALADWCAIVRHDEGATAIDDAIIAHVDAGRRDEAMKVCQRLLAPGRDGWNVPRFAADLGDHATVAAALADGWLRAADVALPRGLIRVPMLVGGSLVGSLVLGSLEPDPRPPNAALGFAAELAGRCALAVRSARLYAASRAAVRMRDDFIAVASHELRTPLTPLQLQLQRLVGTRRRPAQPLPPERMATALATCVEQVGRLTVLVDNLLDVSRLTSGGLRLRPAPTDLHSLVEGAVARMGEDVADLHLTVEPGDAGRMTGVWDAPRIEQVVVNLLTNANRYGRGRPVGVALRRDGPWAIIEVRDQGIGIAADKIDAIFGRFTRAVTPEAFGGLGLGLFIVHEIVAAHGGEVTVTSAVGVGSTFMVRLPLQPPSPPRQKLARAPDRTSANQ